MQRPLRVGYRITSNHGDPVPGSSYGKHLGNDYAVPLNTEVFAPVSGRVRFVGWSDAVGRWIEIEEDLTGRRWRFLHLNRQDVAQGQWVGEGTRIGLSGSTGSTSTGPHLHVDCRKAGTEFGEGYANFLNVEQLFVANEKANAGPKTVHLPASTPGGTWTLYHNGSALRKGTSDQKAILRPGYFTGNNPPGITYTPTRWLRDAAGIYAAEIVSKDFGPGTIWLRNTDAVIK